MIVHLQWSSMLAMIQPLFMIIIGMKWKPMPEKYRGAIIEHLWEHEKLVKNAKMSAINRAIISSYILDKEYKIISIIYSFLGK